MVDLTVTDAQVENTAQYVFDGTGLTGCQSEDGLALMCENKGCGGLGCGACDDRSHGCNADNQCQDYCETDTAGVEIPLANRCDAPNPAGYPQYCAQEISMLCDEVCCDLTSDPENCGACGRRCSANVMGQIDGVSVAGVSCRESECQCMPGYHGLSCSETQCGDGIQTPDEDCDDGNDSNGDQCANTCVVLDTASCVHPCNYEGTFTQDPSPLPLAPSLENEALEAFFGYSVAIHESHTIVGAPEDDVNGISSGSAHIFSKSDGTWTRMAKLLPDDGQAGDKFGWSVGISSNTAIIGARARDDNGPRSGVGYVFSSANGSWSQLARLVPNDGSANDEFGWSVAVSNNTIAVGAPGDADFGPRSGSVYVFSRIDGQWTQQAKLTPRDGDRDDYFGYSVSLSGETIVVGAHGKGDIGDRSGAAYVFEWNGLTWIETAKLIPNDGDTGDWFGFSVSVSSETVLVGARNHVTDAPNRGAAYIFSRGDDGTWNQSTKLTAGDESQLFGSHVALSGPTALIGTGGQGPAYLFQKVNEIWSPLTTVSPSEGAPGLNRAVSLSGDSALVGTYFVNWPAPRCTQDGACFCVDGAGGVDCSGRPNCGDGIRQTAEQCDDGNVRSGDGCDNSCHLEN